MKNGQHHVGKAEPPPTSTELHTLRALPADMLKEASRRLGDLCLGYAIIYFVLYFVFGAARWFIRGTLPGDWAGFLPVIAACSVLMAIVLYVLSRSRRLEPVQMLDLGLFFEVVGALGIAIATTWGVYSEWTGYPVRGSFFGTPWECVWIICFAIVAPNSTGKTLLAAMSAASMSPLILLFSKATGATSQDAPLAFLMNHYVFTNYLCAILAVLISRRVLQYGARLKQARDIGQYRLNERLGEGGMAEVWRADHQMLARPAAIKLIRPEVLGGDEKSRATVLSRFEREARATAQLRSAHTIEVYDFGVADDGRFYYVMELLEGIDLDSLVERFGPAPPERVLWWLRQVCHSLHEAHEQGMIHRDVKPSNIFACRQGPDYDFVKVLDFGLVKTDEGAEVDAAKLTHHGAVWGTPSFMAPEMARSPGSVDARADLYSLGCVAYWLLTGQPVFEGDTPLQVMTQHVTSTPIPPSELSELPIAPELDRIVLDCLAKDPSDRPESARKLDIRLAACPMPDEWTGKRAEQWWRRNITDDA